MADTQVDVAIIGAGASGAVAATVLARRGFSVVCLEQGDWPSAADIPSDQLGWEVARQTTHHPSPNIRRNPVDYPVDDSEAAIKPLLWNGVGGSTIRWGAHFPRFRPSDFRVRSLDGVADDWPISYDDLAPYFEENDRVVVVAGLAGDPGNPPRSPRAFPPLGLGAGGTRMARAFDALGWHWWPADMAIAGDTFGANRQGCNACGPCDLGCPRGARMSSDNSWWPLALAAGARLITHARVFEVELNARGLAKGVAYLDREGKAQRQRAGIVMLAANGLGTARLLLMSASGRHPQGLANRSGLVGKRLMHHPTGMVTGVFDERMDGYKGPFAASILSQHFYETDRARGFVRGFQMQCVRSDGPVGAACGGYLPRVPWGRGHHAAFGEIFARTASLTVTTEDLPEEHNRVTLSPTLKDPFGLPAPKIHYRVGANTQAMLDFGLKRATEAFQAAGAKRTIAQGLVEYAGFHLLGTARMGTDPATSVVNAECQTHDVPNLYIIDGSVFVTAAALNPTSTIQAIALRAATRLADQRRTRVAA
jgi:choline dehydrogenase-like flavoprotein